MFCLSFVISSLPLEPGHTVKTHVTSGFYLHSSFIVHIVLTNRSNTKHQISRYTTWNVRPTSAVWLVVSLGIREGDDLPWTTVKKVCTTSDLYEYPLACKSIFR